MNRRRAEQWIAWTRLMLRWIEEGCPKGRGRRITFDRRVELDDGSGGVPNLRRRVRGAVDRNGRAED